eukprot:8068425-Alexandrium_andersonii.AAC.1
MWCARTLHAASSEGDQKDAASSSQQVRGALGASPGCPRLLESLDLKAQETQEGRPDREMPGEPREGAAARALALGQAFDGCGAPSAGVDMRNLRSAVYQELLESTCVLSKPTVEWPSNRWAAGHQLGRACARNSLNSR